MSDELGDFIGFLTNQKETAVTPDPQPEQIPLERAKELRLKHANHNQASHGFRFGKTPSLEQARRYRKAGVLQDYTKRARDKKGVESSPKRNARKQLKDAYEEGVKSVNRAADYHRGNPAFQGGKALPPPVDRAFVKERIGEFMRGKFNRFTGQSGGTNRKEFIGLMRGIASSAGHNRGIYEIFGKSTEGFLSPNDLLDIGLDIMQDYGYQK